MSNTEIIKQIRKMSFKERIELIAIIANSLQGKTILNSNESN